jgi:hypothetical protein
MTETASRRVAERLALALDDFAPADIRGDKKAFQRAMRARLGPERAQGTSYPAVLGYFAGKVSPSLEWLTEAADVLGVRLPWLVCDSGPALESVAVHESHGAGYVAGWRAALEWMSSAATRAARRPQ